MATVDGKPYSGPYVFNLENVRENLIDLNPGALRGLRAEQKGLPGMLEELARSVPSHGEAAGISLKVHTRIVENTATIETLAVHERDLAKALEVVRETRRKLEHDREHDIGLIVDVVTSTAQRTGDTALLAAFEQTIQYKRQTAIKGVQTRRKNEAAEGVVDAPADGENA